MTALVIIIIFVGLFVGTVALAAKGARANLEIARATRDRISNDYQADEIYTSVIDGGMLAISFARRKVILGSKHAEQEYDFGQIVKVEVIQNGTTVTQTNRGSQLLGAAAGGLVFGGVGAIIGGLSGSTRARSRIVELSLKVWVDDQLHPIHEVRFFRAPSRRGVDPQSVILRPPKAAVERIHAHLLNAMRQADRASSAPALGMGVDQLHKLFEMKQAGALTDAEFAEQKSHFLARRSEPAQLEAPVAVTFRIVLISAGARPVKVIQALRGLRPGFDLKSASSMVRTLPATVRTNVTEGLAEEVRRSLVAAGAEVEVRQN